MLQLHLDPVGGMAGDMFVAAMLDLRPDLEPGLKAALALCPLLEGVACELVSHDDGILTGLRFLVRRSDEPRPEPPPQDLSPAHPKEPGEPHDHGAQGHSHDDPASQDQGGQVHGHREPGPHHHNHVDWRAIREALAQSQLDVETRKHAIGIFTLLAEAEGRVHGRAADDVVFHEVGAWDSVADIVSAAWLITQLAAERWSVGVIPIGSGRVRSAHGLLPVPAPAAALLLEGFAMIDDGIGGERVTPTGAAILAYLCRPPAAPAGARTLQASSHGFGTRRLPGISNCLRVLAFETAGSADLASDKVAVLEFEIDDQTGEDIAEAVAHLRETPGALDIVQAAVFGKKGRVMTHLRILADPARRDDIIAAAFDQTTTLGIRHSLVERAILRRETTTIEHDGRTYRAKIARRPSGRTTKIEADDIAGVGSAADRARLRARLEDLLKGAKETS